MERYWKSIIHPIIKLIKAKQIIEIGSDEGINTKNILDFCTKSNAYLTSIDPSPNFDVEQFKLEYPKQFTFIKSLSLDALPELNTFDAILIDGDHNWYTVYNELKIIEKNFKNEDSFPFIFLHEVGWPYSRRDKYYNPNTIPQEYIHDYEKSGIDFHKEALVKDGGFNSNYYNACSANTLQNGVLTAIEDFVHESGLEFTFIKIPLFNGLGILFIKDFKLEKKINEIINNSDLFQVIENELIETQVAKDDYRDENNRLIKEKEEQYKELVDMTNANISNELKIKDVENEILTLNNENQQLKNELNESKINVHVLTSQKNLIYSENKQNIIQLQKTKTENQSHVKEINNLETKLQISNSQKNIILNELNNNKNIIQNLSVTYQNLEKENNNLKIEIESKNSKFSELLSINNNQQEEIIELQDTINNYAEKIEEYELSTSWKITKPLRIISNKVKFKRKNE